MKNAVIVGAVRTAVGRKNGKLAGCRPDDLLADTLKALVARVKIDPSEVEDVVDRLRGPGGRAGASTSPATPR